LAASRRFFCPGAQKKGATINTIAAPPFWKGFGSDAPEAL